MGLLAEALITACILATGGWILNYFYQRQRNPPIVPTSVNYHFTRRCNYACGFCFHTAKDSYLAPESSARAGLQQLAAAGMKKINFAGGEPFLYANLLGEMVKFCKRDLKLQSVSIVSNGSLITNAWLQKYGPFVDILAVSCDSFDEDTNVEIGRGKGAHVDQVVEVARLCRVYGIKFKLNTVVNRYNFREDMNERISAIAPFRWKCFQVLVVAGENDTAADSLRDASRFLISKEEFDQFCDRHRTQTALVPEPNNLMKTSYLILDEHLRFLNKVTNAPTKSILEVGVQAALRDAGWDQECFIARGGVYDWSREPAVQGCGGGGGAGTSEVEKKALDW